MKSLIVFLFVFNIQSVFASEKYEGKYRSSKTCSVSIEETSPNASTIDVIIDGGKVSYKPLVLDQYSLKSSKAMKKDITQEVHEICDSNDFGFTCWKLTIDSSADKKLQAVKVWVDSGGFLFKIPFSAKTYKCQKLVPSEK